MKLLKIWNKIGKQPLGVTKNRDVTVFIEDKQYAITNIRYESGRFIGFNAIEILKGSSTIKSSKRKHGKMRIVEKIKERMTI